MMLPSTFKWTALLPILPILRIRSEHVKDTFYKRYPKYPQYCSTPEEMQTRAIPPLKDHLNTPFGETRLAHVTSIIRHGARTPYATRNYKCWDNYWENEETGVWDCDLKTIMAPPMISTIEHEEGVAADYNGDDFAFFLFEKRFDALRFPADELTNELNGTCQLGQLILQGYEQEITNGHLLRDAYLFRSDDYSHDERMRLINTDSGNSFDHAPWDDIKYRCDDDQRTVMSGQVLLRGMFEEQVANYVHLTGEYPVIQTHTADRKQDILAANSRVCPRLKTLQVEAVLSDEYQSFNISERSEKTREYIMRTLGKSTNDFDLLDCLMTTICTDRPLPDGVDDFGKVGSRFEEVAEFSIKAQNKIMLYNNSEYAKLAMAPLWTEIMDNIRPWLQDSNEGDSDAPKIAIFSGHDTTLMPLLASIGPKLWNEEDWPPYASMLLIEIHELIDGQADQTLFTTDYAFRLLFNGKILTSLIPGCSNKSELCDVTQLLTIVDPLTNEERDCSVPSVEELPNNQVVVKTKKLMSTKEGILLVFGLITVSAMIGAVATFRFLTGRFPWMASGLESYKYGAVEEERMGLQEDGFEDEDHYPY